MPITFVKLALKSRELNKQFHKNKYQKPNIEEKVYIVVQTISERNKGDVFLQRWILLTRTANYL